MFLKKIVKIRNIGKFHQGGISGGEYGKYTLFYAGNGRGKTTFCAILRCMKADDPTMIGDRRTLGETADPEVQLLLDTGFASFGDGKWKNRQDALHFFDGTFVTENVHAGEQVSTDHRRSIYRVIVGSKGVQLAEEVDALDLKVTDVTTKIGAERKALQQHVPTTVTFEKFLGFVEDPDIDTKIAEQKSKILAASQATEIASKPLLKPQSIPSLPTSLETLLGKTIAGVSADAAKKVEEHLAKFQFAKDGQSWLATGLHHVQEDSCPFCAANVKGNLLVDLYRQYFDQAYADFKAELIAMQSQTLQGVSEAEGLRTKARFEGVGKELGFWRAFGKVDGAPIHLLDAIPGKLAVLHAEAKKAIQGKIASPLEVIDTSGLQKAIAEWQVIADELKSCNDSLVHANSDIQVIKTSTASVNKAALEATLVELEAIKKRYSPRVKALADGYISLTVDKFILVGDKEKKKGELDTYDATVLSKYHNGINEYLTHFGAGFRVLKSEKTYAGKVPQWMYTIEINQCPVDVTKRAGQGEPSFQTAMSAGDRSTLALAFFLAQLDLDPFLKDTVAVFDDPFTSLDEFRRTMTAKTIFRVGQKTSQVIVLSHDKHFLKAVADAGKGVQFKTFQISSINRNSSIEEWDLNREVKEGYLQDHVALKDFYEGHGGEAKSMRTMMRPLLEKYIRYRFPNQIPDGKWLGDMLGIVNGDPNHPLRPIYRELDDINQYTAPFHHDPNTAFNEDEVRTYVGRTLDIVGGC
jgi:wobble nucleotide-excising tRNase